MSKKMKLKGKRPKNGMVADDLKRQHKNKIGARDYFNSVRKDKGKPPISADNIKVTKAPVMVPDRRGIMQVKPGIMLEYTDEEMKSTLHPNG